MAQKNTLQYIILGLLAQEARTGYDLTQTFKDEIGEFWQAKHSQVYPLLARLEEQGLISHEIEVTGTKLEKKVYSLTAAGHSKLNEWLSAPTPELAATKDEFILKLYFIKDAANPELRQMLLDQTSMHREKVAHLTARRQILFSTVAAQRANYGHYLILDHALEREQHYVEWLDHVLAALTN